ncbi:MAG TPA: UDP-N-acetylmuramoyl-L-alanine--D-glutamate ligase [Candidatus Limnocylindria bacterium]|nr:UDP-N-acetylmuramoyl-L-alanine--D-glutamate ligase [Candidatus Limnocylindria bacterium]
MTLPRRALVVGFQRTGQAVARVLRARGTAVRVLDARPASDLGVRAADWEGVELRLGDAAGAGALDGVDLVVPSPGVPRRHALLAEAETRGIPIASEIELAARLGTARLVAITGTNGKSTTTTLVGRALELAGVRTFTGGNLGRPLIEAVGSDAAVWVAEVSSFQLEWVERFRPAVGCLLNVTPDHLDRHADFAEYRDAKARLFAAQTPADAAVVNRDDPVAAAIGAGLVARRFSFGERPVAEGAFVADGAVVVRLAGREERVRLERTRLAGRHNTENVMAAALVARLAGAPLAAVQQAVDTMDPLPHRLTLVAERAGVRWYDDSKATNVGAAVKSLASFAGPVVLLAGGVDKGGDYAPLAEAARDKARLVLVFGAARERIAASLAGAGVAVRRVDDLTEAVETAAAAAQPGDVVLLAPACSSFDMFRDYAERGRAFARAVEELG